MDEISNLSVPVGTPHPHRRGGEKEEEENIQEPFGQNLLKLV